MLASNFNKTLGHINHLLRIIIGLATYISHGIVLKSLFLTFLGFLGLDFGRRFLDNDVDFNGSKMITVLNGS